MSLRNGHGKGRGRPHVEVALKDLPAPVPAPAATPSTGNRGRFTRENAAAAGRAGGLAKARRNAVATARTMGLGRYLDFVEDGRVKPFVDEGERWMVSALEGLSRDVGGGELSAEVCSIVQGAAWQKAFSSFLFDLASRESGAWVADKSHVPDRKYRLRANTELMLTASRLAESHRQQMLAAYELAAREAVARAKGKRHDRSSLEAVGWSVEDEDEKK